jgi:hypothetical protein
MANDTVKSASLTNLDASPLVISNAGQGAVGRPITVDDFCAATAAGLQSSGSYYKLVRIPSIALVKSVIIATDVSPNLSGTALAIDLNLIFSDSTIDGTPTFLQGLIPTSANTGGTTTIASYSSPNKIYGTVKPAAAATAGVVPTDEIFNGLGTNYSFTGGFTNLPLFQLFGFTDGRGQPSDPDGYFDLLAYVATGATTGGACNIYSRVTYVV